MMSDYFIKYENVAIHACRTSKLRSAYSYAVIPIGGDMDYELKRLRYPYANCVKIDLREQLFGKNLKRTLPKRIMDEICNLAEIMPLIRDEKIERLLNNR